MKKKVLWIILSVGIAISAAILTTLLIILNTPRQKKEITGISFASQTVVYDEQPHSLEIAGTLPEGVMVTYDNKAKTDVGVYPFTAHFEDISGKYMVPEDMTATLTILPAKLSVSLEDKTVIYDGQEHTLEITGELPQGISVVYENNRQTEIGSYTVTASFIHENLNYEPLEPLQAVLTIKNEFFDLEEIQFPDAVFVYDGTAKSAVISSELPDGVWVEYENNGKINAGSYEVKAVFRSVESDEVLGILYAMLSIEKAEYDMTGVSFASTEVFYDGATHVLLISGNLPDGVSVRYENNRQTEIGEVCATAIFSGDSLNYKEIPAMQATLTISKGILRSVSLEDRTVIYDGTEKYLEYSGHLPVGVTVVYQNNGKINAGSYEVIAVFHDDTDHYRDLELTAILTIEKAVHDMSGILFSDLIVIYDGSPHTLEITGELPEGVSVRYTENSLISAGQLTVVASFDMEDTVNYQPIPNMQALLTVAPAELEGVSLENLTVPYDGKIHGLVLTGELPEGVTYDFINNYHSEIGEYMVSVHFNIPNYQDLTAKLTITKARYSMDHVYFHGQTFTYDHTLHRIEITGVLPQGVSVVYENNTLLNVGEVLATARFILEDTEHYEEIAPMTAVLKVVESEIEGISFEDATYTYDGTVHSVAVRGELPEGVSVEYQNNFQLHAGTYTVIARFTDATGNYMVPEDMTAVLKIVKADFAKGGILFEDRSFIYNGKVHRLEVYCEDLPSDITVVYENNDKTDAGVYTVKASFEDTYGDYNVVAPVYAILTIERAVCDMSGVAFLDTSYPYDGTEHKLEITGNLPDGVSVSYTPNSLVGLGRLEVTASFSVDEKNYYPIAPMYAVLTITQGTLSGISFQDISVVYDGSYHDICIAGELPEGVEVRYINNHQCNAGTYTVLAEFSDSVGYYTGMTATLTIVKAVYDMSGIVFSDTAYTYDGAVHTLEITGNLPEGVTVSYSENELTDAGRLLVTASFTGNENYEPIADMTAILTVNKATLQGIVFSNDTVIYDGDLHGIYAFGYPSEIRVIYFNNEGTDAGVYTATATFIGNGNYEPIADMTAVLTILPREIEAIPLEDETFVLDGKTHSLSLRTELPLGVTAVFENNVQLYEGNYTVKMTLECSAGNYILPDPVYAVLTIVSDGSYHSVIFHLDAKEEIRIVKDGEALTDIPLPSERAGYTGSWTYDFTEITSKMECDATYVANLYTVSFETGTEEEIESIIVTFNQEFVLPVPERADYVFQKWIDGEGQEIVSGIYTVPSDMTLYAVWKCRVIYQNEAGYIYEEDMVDSQELTAPKRNYSMYLTGWYVDIRYEKLFDFNTPVEGNMVLYAKYEYDYLYEISEDDTAVITEVIHKDKAMYAVDLIQDIYPVSGITAGIFNGCSNMQSLSLSLGSFADTAVSFGYLFGTEPYDGATAVAQSDNVYYIPSSLRSVFVRGQSISYGAFYGCTMLEECILEDVGSVGGYAFAGCSGLESLTLIGDISQIEESAFTDCASLNTVYVDSLAQWCKIRFAAETANPMLYADAFYVSSDSDYIEITELNLSSVEEVGDYQFAGFDKITKVAMPDTVSVGAEAFKGLSCLSTVEFGSAMRWIDTNAFAGCIALATVYYTGTMEQWCEISLQNSYATPMAYADSFYQKTEDAYTPVTEIEISGISVLGNYQFYGFAGVQKISLSEDLSEIGSYAFAECDALEVISFSSAVKNIAKYAFYNSEALRTVMYDGTVNDWAEIVFTNQYSTPMQYAREIEFTRDADSENAVLSEEIKSIGDYQFYGLTNLKTILLSDFLTGVGNSAFYGCIGLSEITFGTSGSVKFLSNAFYGCTALKSVFYTKEICDWQDIRFVNLGATPLNMGASVYVYGNPVESVEILKDTGAYQFYGFRDMTTAVIGTEVTTLGKVSLAYCLSLTEVVLPNTVISLGNSCFEGDAELISVLLGEGISSVPEACFKGCEALSTVVMPAVKTIGSYAFTGCLSLKQIDTSSITQLGESAFYGCSQLESIDLTCVSSIPTNAFMNCAGLTSIALSDTLQTIKSSAFNGCTGLERIVLPLSVQSISAYAFMGCSQLNIFAKAEAKPTTWDTNWAVGVANVYWYRQVEPEESGLFWHYEQEEVVPWTVVKE